MSLFLSFFPSFFSVLGSDCIELDFKEISYLVVKFFYLFVQFGNLIVAKRCLSKVLFFFVLMGKWNNLKYGFKIRHHLGRLLYNIYAAVQILLICLQIIIRQHSLPNTTERNIRITLHLRLRKINSKKCCLCGLWPT